MRIRRWTVAVCVIGTMCLAGAAAGCGGSASGPTGRVAPRGTSSAGSDPGRTDPTGLVDTWRVLVDGADTGAILILGDRVDGGLQLFLACGLMSGEWRANAHAMFVGSEDGGDGACFADRHDPWPSWLHRAVGYRADGGDELLVDSAGQTLARLAPGGHPSAGPNDSAEFASPPVLTPKLRAGFAEPAPLPAGVEPADSTSLSGRWVPVGTARTKAFVSFAPDGDYTGSDGCNGVGGRYVIGPDGLVLATSGPSTAVGCENAPLAGWVASSGRLGTRAGRLVFVDPNGKILGEARRS